MKKFVAAALTILLVVGGGIGLVRGMRVSAHAANGLEVTAKSAYLMNFDTGTEIYAHNATERRPIASMVKIMTLTLALEEIDAGRLAMDDTIVVSQNAASMGGSQAFLDANQSYTAGTLIQSIAIASANDSCVAMAEHITGSVEGFVARMNEKAAALGMTNTNFVNCTGLPAANHYSCARDVAVMTRELLTHPAYFSFSTVWMEDLVHPSGRVTGLTNTNKLLRSLKGCDGGKTGFTNEAGFCISATAKRDDMRLISVIVGGADSKSRFSEAAKLANYGFANFENKRVITKGDIACEVDVIKGKQKTVKVVYGGDVSVFAKRGASGGVETVLEIAEVGAPVIEGEAVGKVLVTVDGVVVGETTLCVSESVEERTFLDNLKEIIRHSNKSAS